jgi:hypothetical protein
MVQGSRPALRLLRQSTSDNDAGLCSASFRAVPYRAFIVPAVAAAQHQAGAVLQVDMPSVAAEAIAADGPPVHPVDVGRADERTLAPPGLTLACTVLGTMRRWRHCFRRPDYPNHYPHATQDQAISR